MGFDWWRDAEQDDMSAQAIIDRVAAEWRAARERERTRAERPDPACGLPAGRTKLPTIR
ncbi:hypothetical protein K8O92_12905 [Nocardia asteroides]|nr:hypothetical protein K8O92_12905 [Nocardia asteroides]